MMKENLDISKIIASYMSGTISDEDKQILDNWIAESDENRRLFERITNITNINIKDSKYKKYNTYYGWLRIQNSIKINRRKTIILNLSKYAAIFVLPLILGLFLWLNKDIPKVRIDIEVRIPQIKAGTTKAKLTLADGSTVNLAERGSFEMKEKDGTNIVNKNSRQLSYEKEKENTKNGNPQEKVMYNIVETPEGGEYSLKLSDGTTIHLNAKSKLKFPVIFIGNSRKVELDGQAYFDVTKDKTRPFIVTTNNVDVKVLGTSFDISSYNDDEKVITTLVEGAVKLKAKGVAEEITLTPSHQAIFNKVKRNIGVEKVDTRLYTAWKDGMFRFKDQRLEDIMIVLSRWYDVDVYFMNSDVKDLLFGCNVNKYESIEPLLKIFESTEKVKFEIKNKSIIIK